MKFVLAILGVVWLAWASGCRSTRSGMYVDGTHLKHQRVVAVRGPVHGGRLDLQDLKGDVDLQVVTGEAVPADLEVTVYEAEQGDAVVDLTRTGLAVRTQSGRPAVIHSIRGTVPNLPLTVRTVSGDIRVTGAREIDHLRAESTSGDVTVETVEGVGQLSVSTVSGRVAVRSCRRPGDVDVRSVSGPIAIENVSEIDRLDLETVSGDVDLTACHMRDLRASLTSGDLSMRRGSVENLRVRSVSGDARLDRMQCGEIDFDSISGKMSRR